MEIAFSLISLLIAIVSLIVAVVALNISKSVLKYTSREFLPELEWDVDTNDSLFLQNKSINLFKILQVGLIKINYHGYEDQEKRATIQVPLITVSLLRNDLQNASKITISKDTAFACAYICPYDPHKITFLENKIRSFINQNKTKIYLPSLQSVTYLIEVIYTNTFKENKTIYLMKRHYHGSGYNHSLISEEKFSKLLQQANIPAFEDSEIFWEYVSNKYANSWSN
jgi:hypothetical protein